VRNPEKPRDPGVGHSSCQIAGDVQTGGNAGHVLVVDDDADVRVLLCAELRRTGCRADDASSGPQGLVMAASRLYDAVVVDQLLPGLVGLELLRALRESNIDVPAILITGHGTDNLRAAAVALGVTACFDKPIHPSQVATVVALTLEGRRAPWPNGVRLFQARDGATVLRLVALLRSLVRTPASVDRQESLRRLAQVVADPQLSLHEFVAASGALRRLASRPGEGVDDRFLLTLLAHLSRPVANRSGVPLFSALAALLDRELVACHLSVSDLAARLGVRLGDLERACALSGMTPAQCRAAFQMRRIVQRLVDTPREHVKQITYQVGFEYPPNLTRAFRAYFGLSPQEFRVLATQASRFDPFSTRSRRPTTLGTARLVSALT
jgi:DNA-binding response OmpR family regulator